VKRTFFIVLTLWLLVGFTVNGSNLKAYFTYCTFNSPEKGPYIETYLSVLGSSVRHVKKADGKFQGSIQITLIFKQGDQIKNFKKYNLLSPELDDTTSFINFIDQQRIPLPNGTYTFEIEMRDKNSAAPPFRSTQGIEINYTKDVVSISDIELVESFSKAEKPSILTKSGYNLVPFVSDFYPKGLKKISFYAEIYNTDIVLGENEKYLVNYLIQSHETGFALNHFRGFARQSTAPVNVILSEFNIEKLPSGNYNLLVEIRNRNNEVITTKNLFFQRSNPDMKLEISDVTSTAIEASFVEKIISVDTIREYVKSVRPISTEMEMAFADNQLNSASLSLLQQFFLKFWVGRDASDPEGAWNKYQNEVAKANKAYSTRIKQGYDTERGRIFLRYGSPNTLATRHHETSAYPYEIWHYYTINSQSNVKFVFYNRDLVTNDFDLLHSTAIGEIRDYRWMYRLQKRTSIESNLDIQSGNDHWGNEIEDLFNNPR